MLLLFNYHTRRRHRKAESICDAWFRSSVSTAGDQQLDFPVAEPGQDAGPERINTCMDAVQQRCVRCIKHWVARPPAALSIKPVEERAPTSLSGTNLNRDGSADGLGLLFLRKVQILRTPHGRVAHVWSACGREVAYCWTASTRNTHSEIQLWR